MKVAHIVGARPNFMKIAPLMRCLQERGSVEQLLIHTGQHYDPTLSDAFFEDLDLPYPDHFLGVGSGSHAEQTARVLLALEPVLAQERPDVVVVPGDVNSTMAAAVTAVKLHIPIAHLEAGLRSGDRSMPEEHNRVVTDHLADVLLTPSRDADENLVAEGIAEERIVFVGNAMIDSLRHHEGQARALDVARREFGVDAPLLVTLHRPGLVDHRERLLETMRMLEEVAAFRTVLFPVHPRTAHMLRAADWAPLRVRLIEPQGYLRFLSLLCSAAAVLTDSGGVQEETTALGVPCFTLRGSTERPITVSEGTNTLLGVGTDALDRFRSAMEGDLEAQDRRAVPEGWEGKAGERCAAALLRRYGRPRERRMAAARSSPPTASTALACAPRA